MCVGESGLKVKGCGMKSQHLVSVGGVRAVGEGLQHKVQAFLCKRGSGAQAWGCGRGVRRQRPCVSL